jgi:hypothetical protein
LVLIAITIEEFEVEGFQLVQREVFGHLGGHMKAAHSGVAVVAVSI